jgi:hypothetical protein
MGGDDVDVNVDTDVVVEDLQVGLGALESVERLGLFLGQSEEG